MMRKRLLSGLLVLVMVLSLLPVAAFAAGGTEEAAETPVCSCQAACTAETMDADCAVCGAEGAAAEGCGQYAPVKDGQANGAADAPEKDQGDAPDGAPAEKGQAEEPVDAAVITAADEQILLAAAAPGSAVTLNSTPVSAMQNGIGGIHGYDANNGYSYIYYGTYNNPIKWRVLDDQTNTGESGLFLLSDALLGTGWYGGVYFDNSGNDSNAWQSSTAKTWCNDFYGRSFSNGEQGAVLATTKSDEAFTRGTGGISFAASENILNGDKVFFLSAEEAENSAYGFTDDNARIANYGNSAGVWWLRSPYTIFTNYAGVVFGDGPVYLYVVSGVWAARPAFNLNLNSVLFTSAAVGGKPDGGLTPISEYTGNEWKLTLKDSNRNFAVTETTVSGDPGDTVTLHYTGATAGINEYISVILADNSGAQYYGRVAQPTAENGTVEIKIPSDIAPGDYTLKVFNEQYNGDYHTDYASNFTDIALTVENQPDEQFTLTPGGRYYFDLSAVEMPGTTLETLPDKTLHYVPFTYVGTVDAYSMENETDTAKQPYEHSLFIADYNVKCSLQRETLAEMNLIYGQTYTASNVNYTLRAPSVGDHHRNEGEGSGLAPIDNEWDTIYQKSADYIKNWYKMRSFGQDIGTGNVEGMYLSRGGHFAAQATFWARPTLPGRDIGFRPVLELPAGLAADSLKIVELLTGEFMPGEQKNWINIIVKKGESFKAPSAEGLPRPKGVSEDAQLWWEDENGNYYKPGAAVPANVSKLYAQWGGFGLLLKRGDNVVEVTPDNYTDIFGDGSASFVLPKGETFDDLINYSRLNEAERHKIYSTGKYGENIFPNLKLKNAELTSVTLNNRYIEQVSPFFITLDGKNTIGSLSGVRGRSMTLSILGGGTLALNSISDFGVYAQNDVSVTIADALNVGRLYMFSGSLTVTDDTQAVTLGDIFDGYYPLDVRVFAGNSAQDAVEVTGWQLSPEMQELYRRFYAGETLTNDENSALKAAIKKQWDVIRTQLSGKTYARFTQAWDVTYRPGTSGTGDAATDVKFYGDALTLRDKLFTRSGYTQTGWAAADGGEKVYDFGGSYDKNQALTLYPVWQRDTYAITYDLDGGTAAEGNPDSYTVETETITLKNPTRPGFTFTGWSGTGLTGENNTTVTIEKGSTGDRAYKAHWRFNPTSTGGGFGSSTSTIGATAGTGGTISPAGSVSVRRGQDQTFTITPDKGYAIADVKVDGKSVGAVTSYTFRNVTAGHTIQATFVRTTASANTADGSDLPLWSALLLMSTLSLAGAVLYQKKRAR